ncbi:MAG TPA: DNA repair protein RadC [Pararobbsia sp.]|jgi:DNA repair protein RadC|nr:DNA repair protein RadC [Pararobbsia sp.]
MSQQSLAPAAHHEIEACRQAVIPTLAARAEVARPAVRIPVRSRTRRATFAGFDAARADLPRERLAALGADALSDAQLLAIFLGTGVAGKTATELGQTLIRRFGSLRGVLSAPPAALRQIHGIGPAKMSLLRAIGIAAQRSLADEMRKPQASMTPATIRSFLQHWIGALPHEVFVCIYLDTHNRMLSHEICSRGGLTQTVVHPRELARKALDWNAASVIVGHNHPSGDAEPSQSDHDLTRELSRIFATIEVRLLDHIVVGAGSVVSFHDRGWIGN